MTSEETLKDIKKELRANMNGVASSYMRQRGLSYHVNFGIELPRLHDIAAQYEPDEQIAQQLWNEDVRESKILATMLMPTQQFSPETCDRWASQIPNAEIAQMATLNLFSHLPYARQKAFEWMASEERMLQLCGFLLITRIVIQGTRLTTKETERLDILAKAHADTTFFPLRKAIQNASIHIPEQNH